VNSREQFRRWLASPDAPTFIYFTGKLAREIDLAKGDAKAQLVALANEVWNAPVHLTQRRIAENRFEYIATRARKTAPERWSENEQK
jgi:hypothetical protein